MSSDDDAEVESIDVAAEVGRMHDHFDRRGERDLTYEDANSPVQAALISAYQALDEIEDPLRWMYRRLRVVRDLIYPALDDQPFYIELYQVANSVWGGRSGGEDTVVAVLRSITPGVDLRRVNQLIVMLDESVAFALKHSLLAEHRDYGPNTRAGIESRFKRLERDYQQIVSRDPRSEDDVVRTKLEGLQRDLESALQDVQRSRDRAAVAAGSTGELVLFRGFAEDARRDARSATVLSAGSVASLLLGSGLGFWALSNVDNYTWQLFAAKVAVGLPLFAVSAYLGRLSSHYRQASRWAKTAAVQIRSIGAFGETLSDLATRDELIMVLGRRVFGDSNPVESTNSPDVNELTALVQAIADATKRGA